MCVLWSSSRSVALLGTSCFLTIRLPKEMRPILAGAKLIDDMGASRTHRGCETLILETLLGITTTFPKLTLFPVVRSAYKLAFKAFQINKIKDNRIRQRFRGMDVDVDEAEEEEEEVEQEDPLLR